MQKTPRVILGISYSAFTSDCFLSASYGPTCCLQRACRPQRASRRGGKRVQRNAGNPEILYCFVVDEHKLSPTILLPCLLARHRKWLHPSGRVTNCGQIRPLPWPARGPARPALGPTPAPPGHAGGAEHHPRRRACGGPSVVRLRGSGAADRH